MPFPRIAQWFTTRHEFLPISFISDISQPFLSFASFCAVNPVYYARFFEPNASGKGKMVHIEAVE
jgi:hypothetical protein